MKEILLVTDGSVLQNPGGPGAWACLLRYKGVEKMASGASDSTTNNRMELQAVIEGLKLVKEPCKIELLSDSQYVINAFAQNWLKGWLKRGWKNAQGEPVANQDQWQEVILLAKDHDIKWTWVRGHNGHVDQERVDQLAGDCARARAEVIGWKRRA